MRKLLGAVCAISLVFGLSVGALCDEVVPIVISPNVINIDSQGGGVTVHAEIPYSYVEAGATISTTLDGEEITSTSAFADNCGDLVLKFDMEVVKDMLEDDIGKNVTLELIVDTFEVVFSGSDDVKVIQVSGDKK